MDEIHWTIEPGAVYHYSVGGDPDHTFRILPPPGRNFVVYVEGDIGDAASYPHGAAVQEPIAQDDPWFVLVVGDLTPAEEHDLDAVDNPNAPAEG